MIKPIVTLQATVFLTCCLSRTLNFIFKEQITCVFQSKITIFAYDRNLNILALTGEITALIPRIHLWLNCPISSVFLEFGDTFCRIIFQSCRKSLLIALLTKRILLVSKSVTSLLALKYFTFCKLVFFYCTFSIFYLTFIVRKQLVCFSPVNC